MIFDRIYRDNLWNGDESRSGPGSGRAATRRLVPDLLALVDQLGVGSVLDVGCGDGYWMPDLPGYVGFDWSREAVERSQVRHPDRRYVRAFPSGTFDLVICRDAIQHLSLRDGVRLVERMTRAGRFLLASTYVEGTNVDIRNGEAYRPDLTAEPFSLPQPDRLIFDGYAYVATDKPRDPAKHLGLWRL
jgi:SAM-dependent methyltransferase